MSDNCRSYAHASIHQREHEPTVQYSVGGDVPPRVCLSLRDASAYVRQWTTAHTVASLDLSLHADSDLFLDPAAAVRLAHAILGAVPQEQREGRAA
jgi:hypothetical protein